MTVMDDFDLATLQQRQDQLFFIFKLQPQSKTSFQKLTWNKSFTLVFLAELYWSWLLKNNQEKAPEFLQGLKGQNILPSFLSQLPDRLKYKAVLLVYLKSVPELGPRHAEGVHFCQSCQIRRGRAASGV